MSILEEIEEGMIKDGYFVPDPKMIEGQICEWCDGACGNYRLIYTKDIETYMHAGWYSVGCLWLSEQCKWCVDNDNS